MTEGAIAIIGMAGRFPGARDVAKFWENLKNGVESIRQFSDAELRAAGVSAEELAQPEYVKQGVVLEDLEMFDAGFFKFNPREASIMDPQHRVFLECAWEALEDAGHAPGAEEDGSVGVFAGSGLSSYLIHNLLTNPQLLASAGLFLIRQTGNDKDVLATRVSYELNLHGPSIAVQTACSTSLVAVHMACQSLLNQECDMALAGGVTIEFPHGRGYLYRDGEILSRDGHCRSFDADSSGTVFSSGAGIVVLKRLEDAVRDRDNIRAVILGSAINNDGSRKVGFLAPSVDGQCEVVAEALGVAGVKASEISYVETHGTGTKVGDPIEIKALTQAFRQSTRDKGYCAIGSLKSNIGHTDTAAGIAGLIKTVMALRNRMIPPSLHFEKANPLIDFENSPFFVNTRLREWATNGVPRRAGVTSLGIGGTNAHVVLEEAPQVEPAQLAEPREELVVLSAKSEAALDMARRNLSAYLREQKLPHPPPTAGGRVGHPDVELEDVAYTLQVGRKAFAHRCVVVAESNEEAARVLEGGEASHFASGQAQASEPGVVFMFSGQGSQYVGMGRGLYERERRFREALDECAVKLVPLLGVDLRELLYPKAGNEAEAEKKLNNTRYTQAALFSVEYALAQWWMAHGVRPKAMIGHSIGEYVAACVAGVFSLEDGLRLSAVRGLLMSEMEPGSMLSAGAAAATLALAPEIEIAAINGPEQCVLSGPTDAIEKLAKELTVPCRLLHTSHAFHSQMMEPMLETFLAEVKKVSLRAPKIPYISNVSGSWITAAEATSAEYWAKHLRGTVHWSEGMTNLFGDSSRVYLEVGPGQVLASLARAHGGKPASAKVMASMRHPQDQATDTTLLLKTAGQLWIAGVALDWEALHEGREPRRVPLPTYPWERQRYYIEPGRRVLEAPAVDGATAVAAAQEAIKGEQWFHQRVWRKAPLAKSSGAPSSGSGAAKAAPAAGACWMLFMDETGLGAEIASQLKYAGHEVLTVSAGSKYKRRFAGSYVVRAGEREDYDALLKDVTRNERVPTQIVHLWAVMDDAGCQCADRTVDLSFHSLVALAQAWGDQDLGATNIACVSNGMQAVAGERVMLPARATLMGPVGVIPKEFPEINCRNIDLNWKLGSREKAAGDVIAECAALATDTCVAYRGGERWVERVEPASLKRRSADAVVKEKGVYLITGGMGGIGLELAQHLAATKKARLVLVGRTAVPGREQWKALLESTGADDVRRKIEKLEAIEAAGGEVMTCAADVTDAEQMSQVVRRTRERWGRVDGVIHAAGVLDDAPLQMKTRESLARVLAPKVEGTLALQRALSGEKPDFVILFSSVSSMVAPAGQVDYAAANAFLDAFAMSDTGLPVTALNWGMWGEVGMVAHDEALPVLGRRVLQNSSETVYAGKLSCRKDWVLAEHRYKNGESLVPGTGYLQLAATALVKDRFDGGVEFEDVYFIAPMVVGKDELKEVRVRLLRQEAGFQFSVLSKGEEWTEHARGLIARNRRSAPADVDVEVIRRRCAARLIDFDEQHRTRQEKYFDFGPRWRNLRHLFVGEGEGLAEVQLPAEFAADLERWTMHPALLDLATGSALYLIEDYENADALYLPLSYRRMTVYRPLPARFYSHIRSRKGNTSEREVATFSVTMLDENGHVLAQIEDFAMRHMMPGAQTTARAKQGADYVEGNEALEQPGITTAEGLKALDEILASEMPSELIVARGDFGGSAQATKQGEVAAQAETVSAAAGDIETVLGGWWKELLGVEKIGRNDDFFDLGGHSLVGVRLFAKIRKTYGVDLNLAVLFEARTVARLAELIRKSAQPETKARKTWSALVPIQPNGSKVPIFCVHALGMSVLWYERLAKHLGPDQPFYALQTPLIADPTKASVKIEDLAALYIKEIQELLPNGPYLLGGYSFGGMVAMEMAQQLHALGKQPELLLMFDAVVPGSTKKVTLGNQVAQHWSRVKEEGVGYLGDRLRAKLVYYKFVVSQMAKSVACAAYNATGRTLPDSLRTFQVELVHMNALDEYRFRRYPGKITLIRATGGKEGTATKKDLTLGWEPFAGGGLEIYDAVGGHMTLFEEPNVRELAKLLEPILEAKSRETKGSGFKISA